MIRSLYERLRDSLFALPATIIVALGLAAWGARRVDALVGTESSWLLPTTVDSTRAILSTVATATITVAGIVFSMTAVVVQLATSELSPRVTQSFLRDPYQQVTIGLSVGTFVYSLLVLSDVRGSEDQPFTAHDFSATLAVLLGVVAMIFIVFFIDRTIRNMRIDTVIRQLAKAVEKAIDKMPKRDPSAIEGPLPDVDAGSIATVRETGWVVDIDFDAILDAVPHDSLVRLDLRVGDFITSREVAGRIWPTVDEATCRAVARAVTVAQTRSLKNDPMYGLRQMVDVALRALSPSLNDPTTASDVIRHLGGPIQAVLLSDLAGRVVGGEEGTRIYLSRTLTYSDYVHDTFREIRLNASGEPHVLHALLETLASLIDVVSARGHRGRTSALVAEVEGILRVIDESDMPEEEKKRLFDFAIQLGLDEPISDPELLDQ